MSSSKFTFTTTTDDSEQRWTDKTIEEGTFHVPAEIDEREQWLTYATEWDEEKGGYAKKPHATEVTDGKYGKYVKWAGIRSPEQFTTYMDAYKFTKRVNKSDEIDTELDGMAFVLTEDDDFVFVDLDDCIDEEGHITDVANKFLGSLNTFFEISQSGEGLHALLKAPEGLDDSYQNRNDEIGVELYESGRFVAFCGQTVSGKTTDINECGETLRQLQRKYLDERQTSTDDVSVDFETGSSADDVPDDDVVVQTMCNLSDEFERLHNGSNHIDSNDGANESDLAYVNKLSWICQSRERQMRRIWLNSPRSREKLQRDDYVERTIKTALRSNPDDYQGDYHQ